MALTKDQAHMHAKQDALMTGCGRSNASTGSGSLWIWILNAHQLLAEYYTADSVAGPPTVVSWVKGMTHLAEIRQPVALHGKGIHKGFQPEWAPIA
jgi:hypothetical protein